MYIVSLKFNFKKVLSLISVCCIVFAVFIAALPARSSDVLNNNTKKTAKSIADHIEFLGECGYNVLEKPVQIQEIIIPSEFSSDYEKYNELQKISGFDLSNYKSCRVKKYTYKVLNYDDSDDEVVANIIIYNEKIIGGDISSTVLGGFVHGFIKE